MQRNTQPRDKKWWQDEVLSNMRFARRSLREDGRLSPLAAIYTRDGSIIPTMPDHNASKLHFFRNLQLIAIALDAEAVCVMMETSIAPADTVMPSQPERREEVVSVTICYRDKRDQRHWTGAMLIIDRDANGKVSRFRKIDDDDVRPESFLRNLLAPKRPTATQMAEARQFLERMGGEGALSLKPFHQ